MFVVYDVGIVAESYAVEQSNYVYVFQSIFTIAVFLLCHFSRLLQNTP